MRCTRVALYDIKTGTFDELISQAKSEMVPLFEHSDGFVSYGVAQIDKSAFVSLSTWETRAQADAAAAKAAATRPSRTSICGSDRLGSGDSTRAAAAPRLAPRVLVAHDPPSSAAAATGAGSGCEEIGVRLPRGASPDSQPAQCRSISALASSQSKWPASETRMFGATYRRPKYARKNHGSANPRTPRPTPCWSAVMTSHEGKSEKLEARG